MTSTPAERKNSDDPIMRPDCLEVDPQHLDGKAGVAEPQERRAAHLEAKADAAEDERQRQHSQEDEVVERHHLDELQGKEAGKGDGHAVSDGRDRPSVEALIGQRRSDAGSGDQQTNADDDAMSVPVQQQIAEADDPRRHRHRGEMQAADPALPSDGGGHGAPAEQERPVHFAAPVGRLPAAPQADEQHGERQGRLGLQDDAGSERAQRPGQHRVRRMPLDMEHLRDEHDAGAENGDAGENGGVREGRMLALEQRSGEAVGAKQAAEDQGQPEQPRHLVPMRGNEAHGAKADEHGAEDAERGGEVELG